MPESTITWNGVSSDTLGIRIERFPNIVRGQRKYEQVSVPGRNGDLFLYQDAWNNYEQEYEIFAGDGTTGNVESTYVAIADWLTPRIVTPTVDDYRAFTLNGYCQLIDSYEPNYIRLATFNSGLETANAWNRYGRTVLRFNCRPERFASDAFTAITETANASMYFTLENPTGFNAKPFFDVSFTGSISIKIGDVTIDLNDLDSDTYVDCDSENCFGSDLENYNSQIEVPDGFPVLAPGSNTVYIHPHSPGTYTINIYPRWWSL